MVKIIDFDIINYEEWNPASIISDLANCCASVQQVRASYPPEEFWDQLRQVGLAGLWQHVRILPLANDESEIGDYLQTAIAYRSTLGRLSFRTLDR